MSHEQICAIRDLYFSGVSQKAIAEMYGRSQAAISKAITGKRYLEKATRRCLDCDTPVEGKAKRCAFHSDERAREYQIRYYEQKTRAKRGSASRKKQLPSDGSIVYYEQYRSCGKCRKCLSGQPHGPYWYAFWSEQGQIRRKYVGKLKPARVEVSA